MKKKISIFLCCILLGVIFGLIIYYNYSLNNNVMDIKDEKIYLLQIGAYKDSKNVSKFTKLLPNYYVEYEDGLYHVYIGVLKNNDNLSKIEEFYKLYGNNIYMKEKYINSSEYINMIETYEDIIKSTDKKEVVYVINKELLNKYKELAYNA